MFCFLIKILAFILLTSIERCSVPGRVAPSGAAAGSPTSRAPATNHPRCARHLRERSELANDINTFKTLGVKYLRNSIS